MSIRAEKRLPLLQLLRVALTLAVFFFSSTQSHAHEMGMASLEITETSPGVGHLVFKRVKTADGRLAPVDFVLEPACQIIPLATDNDHPNEVVQTASFQCSSGQALEKISGSGFVRLAPDLIVKTSREGLTEHVVLTPQQPSHEIGLPQQDSFLNHYFVLGAEHMLLGPDHLLFVAGLFLLWAAKQAPWSTLVGLITCFTIGHSLTLVWLTLNWFHLPVRAIETWIALSVLYMAVKVVYAHRDQQFGLTDYVVVIAFGLLHGAGFSAAMLSQQFPETYLLSTLLAFNLGIEVAQVAIILAMIGVRQLILKTLGSRVVSLSHHALLVLCGGMALAWTSERIFVYV